MSPVPLLDDAWVVSRRGPRNRLAADRPYAWLVEDEPAADGRLASVVTIFLTNRECPFRCIMCDLWKNTLEASVAPGEIANQIRGVLEQCEPVEGRPRHLKLYNAGSFFDPRAIPEADYPEIAKLAAPFERVIVECHPKFVGRRFREFRGMLSGEVEVAMGLETAHPEVLRRLNKSMTLDDFAQAAKTLRENDTAVRAFIIVRLPFLTEAEGVLWAKRSLDFAFANGVECCSLIPARGGNGAMEELAAKGEFAPPSLDSLEEAFEYGLSLKSGRVFIDLWDIGAVSPDAPNREARIARLARMNLSQKVES